MQPPLAHDVGLPWDIAVDPEIGAVAPFAAARAAYGDTFAVHSGGADFLFTFSPTGVGSCPARCSAAI